MTSLLNRLFKSKSSKPPAPAPNLGQTAPLYAQTFEPEVEQTTEDQATSTAWQPTKKLDLPQYIVGCGHSVGKLREHNEDAIYTLTTNLVSDSTKLPFGLYIIADGMGGHQFGEIASKACVHTMADHILRKLYLRIYGLAGEQSDESLQEIMLGATQEAHRIVLIEAPGGGTTLTAAMLLSDQMTMVHIGDSRAYLIHSDGKMECITKDHTLVKRLIDMGKISAEEAANHPQRNVLYRALGQGDPMEPDVSTLQIPRAGYLLICSDGLWGEVSEDVIFNIIATAADPQQACQQLVEAANNAGGSDNISVILVRLPD